MNSDFKEVRRLHDDMETTSKAIDQLRKMLSDEDRKRAVQITPFDEDSMANLMPSWLGSSKKQPVDASNKASMNALKKVSKKARSKPPGKPWLRRSQRKLKLGVSINKIPDVLRRSPRKLQLLGASIKTLDVAQLEEAQDQTQQEKQPSTNAEQCVLEKDNESDEHFIDELTRDIVEQKGTPDTPPPIKRTVSVYARAKWLSKLWGGSKLQVEVDDGQSTDDGSTAAVDAAIEGDVIPTNAGTRWGSDQSIMNAANAFLRVCRPRGMDIDIFYPMSTVVLLDQNGTRMIVDRLNAAKDASKPWFSVAFINMSQIHWYPVILSYCDIHPNGCGKIMDPLGISKIPMKPSKMNIRQRHVSAAARFFRDIGMHIRIDPTRLQTDGFSCAWMSIFLAFRHLGLHYEAADGKHVCMSSARPDYSPFKVATASTLARAFAHALAAPSASPLICAFIETHDRTHR